MSLFRDRLFISTIADDASKLAEEYSLGLEIAEFCTAYNMDENFPATDAKARTAMESARRFVFHAPFSELCPAAIDPMIREVTRKRYKQAVGIASTYGIRKVVIHNGFIPDVYYSEWFVPQAVSFWKSFLAEIAVDTVICLENVMEPEADMIFSIVDQVSDPRLRLCLDVGHACTRRSHVPVETWIDREGPYLSHIHLHNNDGVRDMHKPLGTGVLDIKYLIDMIEKASPEATYTIENVSAEESIRWLLEMRMI